MQLENVELPSTQGGMIDLSLVEGRSVIFVYPRTSPPDGAPEGWEMIPGAKGCTAESCTFRDLQEDFLQLKTRVFGVSTQSSEYQ
ncbi:redoxin family protein [Glutamicibacter sp.]|uniref:redoxin family protein n=1 Tax=Glutamicibacter sp. TaxID=1931995 RepID=UPI0028BD4F65|nr:redoxin family protein [Glutamicibacter sp.]